MKQDESILKKYVCTRPFKRVEIFEDEIYPCCVSWIKTPIGHTRDMKNLYNSDLLKKVRRSILDGEYEYCDKEKCAVLMELLYNNKVVDDFKKVETLNDKELMESTRFTEVKFNFDESCSMFCGSCRNSVIYNRDNENVKRILDNTIDTFGKDIKTIDITGAGDPFASKTYLDFLINFDETKFPNLETITIFTNGILLTEEMWGKLEKVHKYIKTVQISIDAATEETYRKIRRGGNWGILMKNIKFLLTIPTIKKMEYIFVVQDGNYKEMEDFLVMICALPHQCEYELLYTKIFNWGTFNPEKFKQIKIWDESHPDFNKFLIELTKIVNGHNVSTDLLDIISKHVLKPKNHFI